MNVKLKVVQGKLKGKRGESAGLEVKISKTRFVIGTASDCHMRCPSSVISPHHCEITVSEGKVSLRDLNSDSGTFLNDERLAGERIVKAGDRMRVGRLEFEVLIERITTTTKVDDFVSDMLVQADEEERATRISTPELRQFQLDAKKTNKDEPAEPAVAEEDRQAALRKKLPLKKPPGKLPPQPSLTAESSVSAAEQTLQKIFEKPKPKRPN